MRAAKRLATGSAKTEIFELLADMPPYNQDLESEPPTSVQIPKDRIRPSDAILFLAPEYNYSVPSVLKNAIDWVSRTYADSAWDGKPVAIMGALIRRRVRHARSTTSGRCSSS